MKVNFIARVLWMALAGSVVLMVVGWAVSEKRHRVQVEQTNDRYHKMFETEYKLPILVLSVAGVIEYQPEESDKWLQLTENSVLFEGARIRAKAGGRAQIQAKGAFIAELEEKTEMVIQFAQRTTTGTVRQVGLKLERGKVSIYASSEITTGSISITTSMGTIRLVAGAVLSVRESESGTDITVARKQVKLENQSDSFTLKAATTGYRVNKGKTRVEISKVDSVQAALPQLQSFMDEAKTRAQSSTSKPATGQQQVKIYNSILQASETFQKKLFDKALENFAMNPITVNQVSLSHTELARDIAQVYNQVEELNIQMDNPQIIMESDANEAEVHLILRVEAEVNVNDTIKKKRRNFSVTLKMNRKEEWKCSSVSWQ